MAILITGGAGYIGSHTMVELLEAEEADTPIEIFLPAGTVIALGNSQVTLNDNATITAYGYNETDDVNNIMSMLRDCTTTEEIIKKLSEIDGVFRVRKVK